ncbi:MAG TPA: hypothetical protein VNL71_03540 [Chloroflexota bacterium]|nr:hypothetical protein [Chloroflexota bacterium]
MGFGPDRDQVNAGLGAFNGHLAQQARLIELLERLAVQEGPGVQTLAISESAIRGGIEADFPTPGAKRWIIPRVPSGGVFAIPKEEAMVTLLQPNTRRLGLSIVNSGEHAVRLYLGEVAGTQAGIGTAWLEPEGGSWDGRLSSIMWCGAICAVGLGGASQVDIAEV